ncbi:MAG: hypothetical protein IJD69_02810 [Alphaproteobacteria bacterium]|nr:hypothetical protein [Alphaproteobacteria bacterium]
MNWFDYLKKTSVVQIATDWKEYRKLKRALGQAEKDMVDTGSVLVHYYDIGEDMVGDNACIKCKQLVDGVEALVMSPCCFEVFRCHNFAPDGCERKCTNDLCAMRRDNNRYCDNKQKYNDLKTAYNSYWANKFAHVK